MNSRLFPVVFTSLALAMPGMAALAQDAAPPPPPPGDAPPDAPGRPGGRQRGEGQPNRGMGQLAPEQNKTAWELEARHVSAQAGLNDSETTQVVMAYHATRENHNKALADIRAKAAEERRGRGGAGGEGRGGQGGGGGAGADEAAGGQGGRGGNAQERFAQARAEMEKAIAEATSKERASFEAALNGFLKPEQTAKVLEGLGNYETAWDRQVWAVSELKLDEDTQTKAMDITQAYASALTKARETSGSDRQALADATREARRKMMDDMKAVLNEEQFGKFQRASGPGGGPRGAPAGAGGGRGGRGGSGAGGGGGAGAGSDDGN